jgi:glycosyltransferase involved in cell wall biosynthesis
MLSVIMPAYLPTKGHHQLLKRAIKSLENQTFQDFNVIVVLNGCYTDYATIKKSIKTNLDLEWLTIEGKASGAIARNLGIFHSKKRYIAQLDADDQYHEEKLEKQINFFRENPEYSFVGSLAADFHGVNDIRPSCYKPGEYQTHMQIARRLLVENVMCHGSIMFKRDAFVALNGYNEKNKPGDVWPSYGRRMWEDWDLWKRAVQKGYRFYNIPYRLYYWSTDTSVER